MAKANSTAAPQNGNLELEDVPATLAQANFDIYDMRAMVIATLSLLENPRDDDQGDGIACAINLLCRLEKQAIEIAGIVQCAGFLVEQALCNGNLRAPQIAASEIIAREDGGSEQRAQ